jgi:hypothetical protein
MIAKNLNAKLFIEGMEVPFQGATISCGVGRASICYIDVVPEENIFDIKPRTYFQIFVRDLSKPNRDAFVEAWDGEAYGINYRKDVASRVVTIPCSDVSNYWDNALLYFFNAQQSLARGAEGIMEAAQDFTDAQKQFGPGAIQATTHSLSSYFLQIIREQLNNPNKDFLDALIAVYEKVENINDFYLASEKRVRITDRIQVRSSGAIEKVLRAQEAIEWLQGVIGSSDGFSSLRNDVQKLMGLIFHDFITVPFPSKVERNTKTPLRGAPIIKSSGKKYTKGQFLFKPNMYTLPPPACNIFYPDEYSAFSFNRSFFQEPTRFIYSPFLPRVVAPGGLSGSQVALPRAYEPKSFSNFMNGRSAESSDGTDLFGTTFTKVLADEDTNERTKESNQGRVREGQFLTNEERMKGILMSQEGMIPSATLFQQIYKEEGATKDFVDGVAKYLFFKKRLESRTLSISCHLKMSVVPGFNVLILDKESPKMSIVAYCQSITHRITAESGGYTQVDLSYARTSDEQDTISINSNEPPLPVFFDPSLFGTDAEEEFDENGRRKFPKGIDAFFATFIGEKASKTVNSLTNKDTTVEAVKELIKQYRQAELSTSKTAKDDLIMKTTTRDYVTLKESMDFLGLTSPSKDYSLDFLEFSGGEFSGISGDFAREVRSRRDIIRRYRDRLKQQRAFRG